MFGNWVENVLLAEMKRETDNYAKVVMNIDGSRAHINLQVVEFNNSFRVKLVIAPQHLTNCVQLLDRTVFKSLKGRFGMIRKVYMSKSPEQMT